jgi:hypothetical protein
MKYGAPPRNAWGMGGRIAALTILGALALAGPAQAENFSLTHSHSGLEDARADGSVTFPDAGGAEFTVSVTDRSEDGWCAQVWVSSNVPIPPHENLRACGVTVQKTYSLSLPGGARCNVSFVDVQVGRIDPSNGNTIELGPLQRIANPCPPLPQPTPVPTPAPPEKIDSGIDHNWTAFRRWTVNERLLVTDIPEGAAVELRCRGKGCPGKRKAVAVRNGKANVHRILRRRHLRVGARLEVRITREGMVGKIRRFTIRRSKSPSTTLRCLPPGAPKPVLC